MLAASAQPKQNCQSRLTLPHIRWNCQGRAGKSAQRSFTVKGMLFRCAFVRHEARVRRRPPTEQSCEGDPDDRLHVSKGTRPFMYFAFPLSLIRSRTKTALGKVLSPKGRIFRSRIIAGIPAPPVLPQGNPDQSGKTLSRRPERCQGDSPSLNGGHAEHRGGDRGARLRAACAGGGRRPKVLDDERKASRRGRPSPARWKRQVPPSLLKVG